MSIITRGLQQLVVWTHLSKQDFQLTKDQTYYIFPFHSLIFTAGERCLPHPLQKNTHTQWSFQQHIVGIISFTWVSSGCIMVTRLLQRATLLEHEPTLPEQRSALPSAGARRRPWALTMSYMSTMGHGRRIVTGYCGEEIASCRC